MGQVSVEYQGQKINVFANNEYHEGLFYNIGTGMLQRVRQYPDALPVSLKMMDGSLYLTPIPNYSPEQMNFFEVLGQALAKL